MADRARWREAAVHRIVVMQMTGTDILTSLAVISGGNRPPIGKLPGAFMVACRYRHTDMKK